MATQQWFDGLVASLTEHITYHTTEEKKLMDAQRCFDEVIELIAEYHATLDTGAQEQIREQLTWCFEALAHWLDTGGSVPHVKESACSRNA